MGNSTVLEALKTTLPMIKQALQLDMQICLCDTEKTIGVWYGDSFKLEIQEGVYFNPNSPADRQMLAAMESGRLQESILPAAVYGVPVRGILSPVFENGEVVGIISYAISMQSQKELEASTSSLNENILQTNESFHKIAESAKTLAQRAENINQHTEQISELTKSTSDIVSQIEKNAKRSNILALNASIESARAGDKGKGFAVVASEMGNLSKSSGESAKVIGEKLEDIFKRLGKIMQELSDVTSLTAQQAEGVGVIGGSLKDIEAEAGALADAVKTIS